MRFPRQLSSLSVVVLLGIAVCVEGGGLLGGRPSAIVAINSQPPLGGGRDIAPLAVKPV